MGKKKVKKNSSSNSSKDSTKNSNSVINLKNENASPIIPSAKAIPINIVTNNENTSNGQAINGQAGSINNMPIANAVVLDGNHGGSSSVKSDTADVKVVEPSIPASAPPPSNSNNMKSNFNPYLQAKPDMQKEVVTAVAVDKVVAGTVVADAYPASMSDEEIRQRYVDQGWDTTEINNIPVATANEALVPADFYTQEEMNVLNAQPVPYAPPIEAITNNYSVPAPPTQPVFQQIQSPQIVLNPMNGGCPVMLGAYSRARVKRDSIKSGICSRDMEVLNNKEELLKYFNMYGLTRPSFYISVEGYHYETHTYTDTDSDGKTTTRTETRKVTDFYYQVDLTNFVFPFGKITTNDQSVSVEEMIDSFLEDGNKLKSLQLKKKIHWPRSALHHLVRGYIRALGWHRELSVYTHTRNKSVRVATDSKRARTWDDCCGRTMMIMTIFPAIAFAIYGSGHRERGMRSIFTLQYGPLQVFEFIRPQLWCPQYRSCTTF